MTGSKSLACCVWLLGAAIVITGLYSGLDHWGRFFPKHLGRRAQMPLDVAVDAPFSDPTSARGTSTCRGARCICSHCGCVLPNGLDGDDYTGDKPDEPVGDRLMLWLCDDDDGQKQFGLSISPGDALWAALAVGSSDRRPSDDDPPSTLSLNALHVRLQI
ncbi:MAG TPA: hypothetical protein VG125_26235 [Pirellulales bacterium]|jgi:hypothetical protein|nr:hypothetical protein [Pirellulales bacterium]